jgi:hypothetical protein
MTERDLVNDCAQAQQNRANITLERWLIGKMWVGGSLHYLTY